MGRKKRGKSAKHCREVQSGVEPEGVLKAPHSFVFQRGQVGCHVLDLVRDMRRVMEPFTASHLKVQRWNTLRDFATVAGPLNVTHLIVFSRTEIAVNMRLIRLPKGPTLTFRVNEYVLSRDVISSLKKPLIYQSQFNHHPLLILNNFKPDANHMKLSQTLLQNMFPSINVNTVNLNQIRRAALFNFDTDTNTFDFRHYAIKAVPTGVSRSTKKLVQSKIPNMGRYTDISDFFLKPGQLSESEFEGDQVNEVELPQDLSTRGCKQSSMCAVRLIELGPRLNLTLIKIQEGICDGEVLFHQFIKKSADEVAQIRAIREKKRKLKEKRRQAQEANVLRKKQTEENEEYNEEGHEDEQTEGETPQRPTRKRGMSEGRRTSGPPGRKRKF